MKQIVVLSGKGGTGKTFVSGALAYYAGTPAERGNAGETVFVDADVDASNLHLLLNPTVATTHEFSGGVYADIQTEVCKGCAACEWRCRFDAITMVDSKAVVDPVACEGCRVCGLVCPADAITFRARDAGRWFESTTAYGPLIHARLFAGEENSGKLVEQVRRRAGEVARQRGASRVLIDGPPGTGCAAKSALTGADLVVMVTEPTPSGIHDVKRVIALAEHFGVRGSMVINKCTLSAENSAELRAFADAHAMPVLGEIPYDRAVVDALSNGEPYPVGRTDAITDVLAALWRRVAELTAPA